MTANDTTKPDSQQLLKAAGIGGLLGLAVLAVVLANVKTLLAFGLSNLFGNSLGAAFIGIELAYLVIIFGLSWLATLVAKSYGFKGSLAGGLMAVSLGLYFESLMLVNSDVLHPNVFQYALGVLVTAGAYAAVLLASQRVPRLVILPVGIVVAVVSPFLIETSVQQMQTATDSQREEARAEKLQKANEFTAYIDPQGALATFKYNASPYVQQPVSVSTGAGAVVMLLRQNANQTVKDKFVNTPEKCDLKGLFDDFSLPGNEPGKNIGCKLVTASASGAEVYTEDGPARKSAATDYLSQNYSGQAESLERYYYINLGDTNIVVEVSLGGEMAGQDPTPYTDQIMQVINRLKATDSTTLKTNAAF